jgi:hypothetical protein
VWTGAKCITHTDRSCLHNLLKIWKQQFYEKELSESIDERYLFILMIVIWLIFVLMILVFDNVCFGDEIYNSPIVLHISNLIARKSTPQLIQYVLEKFYVEIFWGNFVRPEIVNLTSILFKVKV